MQDANWTPLEQLILNQVEPLLQKDSDAGRGSDSIPSRPFSCLFNYKFLFSLFLSFHGRNKRRKKNLEIHNSEFRMRKAFISPVFFLTLFFFFPVTWYSRYLYTVDSFQFSAIFMTFPSAPWQMALVLHVAFSSPSFPLVQLGGVFVLRTFCVCCCCFFCCWWWCSFSLSI